jgi:anti-sigma factor RsiW
MMFCLKEEDLQAYLDGELAGDAGEPVRAHLDACPRCAAALKETERAFAVIGHAINNELPDAIPTARLRARVESALAEQAAPRLSWAPAFWRFGLVAASALIVAGIIVWSIWGRSVWRSRPMPPPVPDLQARGPSLTPSVTPAPQMQPRQSTDSKVVAAIRPRRTVRHRAVARDEEAAEVVTRFFPLREGEDLTALENMRLVRVELPGSALAEVGLPTIPGTINQTVRADVALGDDGLARAIRFVR